MRDDLDLPDSWATPVIHEWPEHARLLEPDGDTVRIIPPMPHGPYSDPKFEPKVDTPRPDDGARLDTYEARRRRTVDEITEDLDRAIGAARRAATGLSTIGYHVEVVAKVEDMIGAGNDARELLDMFEGRVT